MPLDYLSRSLPHPKQPIVLNLPWWQGLRAFVLIHFPIAVMADKAFNPGTVPTHCSLGIHLQLEIKQEPYTEAKFFTLNKTLNWISFIPLLEPDRRIPHQIIEGHAMLLKLADTRNDFSFRNC